MGGHFLSRQSYLTKLEAAVYLRISPRTIDGLISRADLRAYRLGRKVLLKREDLDAFIEKYPVVKAR